MRTITEQEFAQLSARIRSKLKALAQRFNRAAGLASEAEDVAQEALITLWQLSEKGYPVRDAEALAVKITKNLCISRYRKQHLQFQSMTDATVAGDESATEAADAEDIETIRNSEFFDSVWYLRNNTDVQDSGMDPAEHYARIGAREIA